MVELIDEIMFLGYSTFKDRSTSEKEMFSITFSSIIFLPLCLIIPLGLLFILNKTMHITVQIGIIILFVGIFGLSMLSYLFFYLRLKHRLRSTFSERFEEMKRNNNLKKNNQKAGIFVLSAMIVFILTIILAQNVYQSI